MVKRTLILVAMVLAIYLVYVVSMVPKSYSNPIFKAGNYLVFYDDVRPGLVDRIAAYDLAILEPTGVGDAVLARLQESRSLLFGYVSVFEVESYNQRLINLLNDEDYLYLQGEKYYIPRYGCYAGDIRSAGYEAALMQLIRERVVDKGYHGVFLDTIDDIEFLGDEATEAALTRGYLGFIKRLKETYPDLLVIQNRAFKLFQAGSARYVDGLMYEGLKHEKVADSAYYQNLVHDLSYTAHQNQVVVLAIAHENPAANHRLCRELKWLYYYCPTTNNYLALEQHIYSVDLSRNLWEKIHRFLT